MLRALCKYYLKRQFGDRAVFVRANWGSQLGTYIFWRNILKGKPNSTGKIYNPDGSVKQEREYGPDGQPVKDRDYNHGGANHEFPHEHEWKDGVRGPAQPVPSEFSWGAALLGGLITIVELAGYYYGIPVDLPGN